MIQSVQVIILCAYYFDLMISRLKSLCYFLLVEFHNVFGLFSRNCSQGIMYLVKLF